MLPRGSSQRQERASERMNVRQKPRLLSKESSAKAPVTGVINQGSIDYTLCFVTVVLVLIGIIMVFSAGFYNAATRPQFGFNMFHFVQRQGIFAALGFVAMYFMSKIPYRLMLRSGWPLYIVSGVMLVYVTIMAEATGGARRWIEIAGVRFQPSEVMKVAIIMLVAYMIFRNKKALDTWKGLFFHTAIVGFATFLVILEDFSTALVIAAIGMGMLFIASPHVTRFVAMGTAGIGAVVVYLVFLADNFRSARVQAWLDPFSDPLGFGYQPIQSLYAIASGGLLGLGIGQSRQKSFLPEPQNDMIFAIITEELGLAGAALILSLFAILIWRMVKVAMNATDMFGSLVATGAAVMIASQVLINVAVVTNSIPNTGVTLPFISFGGTSLLVTMFLVGVVLNISRYHREQS
ncbi:MAG: putative lipid II flippase FtsW [Defluviitaleaceae bacterium]|nr:putative lipid II flippase FtsW [Defluviitaleaceae bacterium]